MHLSTPIYRLKHQAKMLARKKGVPLYHALNKMAADEGFQSWSHLASTQPKSGSAATILSLLTPGDMILLGARPGQGKTLVALELALKAETLNRKGFFFALNYHERDVADGLAALGVDPVREPDAMVVDASDELCADYIINRLEHSAGPAFVVIDYLQLLDQRRTNPSLDDQIRSLRRFVKDTRAICLVISQIERSFDLSGKPMPDVTDVRLPNPLDLSAFDKVLFLHNGEVQMSQAA